MLKNVVLKVVIFAFVLWAANLSYGFVHEAAHALVARTVGAQVYDLYVDPFGTDAYTTHSGVAGTTDMVMLELAGMAATTLLGFFALVSDYAPLPVFMALRTSIYAFNYAPGTDISTVQQAIGNGSLLISAILVALNLACAAIAIAALVKNTSLREPVLKRFFHL